MLGMRYAVIVDAYKHLEATPKKLEKADILAGFYKECSGKDLYKAVLLSAGQVFPAGEQDLGVASELIKRIISKVTGASGDEVVDSFKQTGDLGLAAERLLARRKQRSLGKKELTIGLVFDNLRKLPSLTGAGSVEKKISLVSELLSSGQPEEAKYIVRTTLGQMRIGVAAGIVRDAIARAFDCGPKDIESMHNFISDYGTVAERAKAGKTKAEIILFKPMSLMLAERGSDLETAMGAFENPAYEIKYDGFRVLIHKKGNEIRIFSRRLEDVTNQFPDIAACARSQMKAKDCIVDGEALAVDIKGNPMPFQHLSRRIQRKYDIEKIVKEIPVQVNLFDLIYANGQSHMKKPLRERWDALKKIVGETKSFKLAEHIETKDKKKIEEFYQKSLSLGQEGVIVKNLDAHYQPGRRVGFWIKVKPILEPLDLVIVGAEWGEGKRSKWLSSMILAARKGEKLVETGRMASGFTEAQLEELTKKLKNLIIEESGKVVKVKPEVVVEIGYEEIQKSPKYGSGYALRFPRLLRIRVDKSAGEADGVKTIEKLYGIQRGRKK